MNASTSKYCNLLTAGEGLVVDIRTEKPQRGESFLACHIKALHGRRDQVEYLDYDARVVGRQAETLIRKAQKAVTAGCEVLISFKAGIRWLTVITYGEGHPRAGEIDIIQKARLLFIHWMDVDGVRVHTADAGAIQDKNVDDLLDHDTSSDARTSKSVDGTAEPSALAASA